MRDIIVTAVIFGLLPLAFWRPYVGILLWTWISFMNPHRLTWGFAYDMPFAMIVALATLLSLLISDEPKKIPWTRETKVLLLFVVWMFITTLGAQFPALAWPHMDQVAKIQLMVFVTMMMMQSKHRINLLVWVMTLSLAFYGVKGGIFTILNGGAYHVRGPSGSFIAGDNEIGLALIMTIPLLRYLQSTVTRPLLRFIMWPAMLVTAVAVVGSQSRGALLGIAAMGAFFWLKSRNRVVALLTVAVSAALILTIMPPEWFARMQTIETYQQDASAMGRINAWYMAFNLAKSKVLGGGFEAFQYPMFVLYAPDPENVHDAHSIYFEVLGEQGFIGLALFLILGLMTWRTASWIIRKARGDPEKRWAADLAAMIQVSLVGYATAGAFLGLGYFDFYYTLVAVVVLCKTVLLSQADSEKTVPAPANVRPGLRAPQGAAAPGVG